jgi:hypothetical protein
MINTSGKYSLIEGKVYIKEVLYYVDWTGREIVSVMIRLPYTWVTVYAEVILAISSILERGGNAMYANAATTVGHTATGRIVLTKSARVVVQFDISSLGYEIVSLTW